MKPITNKYNISLFNQLIKGKKSDMTEAAEIKNDSIICLNCGTECHAKYCPNCGQPTSVPSKLKMKNFGKGVVMSFGRLTPGFFTTAKGLMFRPWEVIRDHIHGKHIRYSPPITMLIQIYLYATIIYSLVDSFFGTALLTNFDFEATVIGYEGDNPLLKLIDGSVVLETLLWGIPICFCIYLGFYRHGARKYNFAEYLAAFFYMFAAISIYDFIFSLFLIILDQSEFSDYLTWMVCIFFSTIVLIKAFPQDKWWKYPLLFLWTALISVVAINIFVVTINKAIGVNLLAE